MRRQLQAALSGVLLVCAVADADAARFSTRPGETRPGQEAADGTPPAGDALTPVIPRRIGGVTDAAGILSPSTENAITALALELEAKTGAEMAVLTVESTAPLDAFDYGTRVA